MAVNIRFLAGENILDARGRLTTDAAARLNKIIELANAATDTLAAAPNTYVAKVTTTNWAAATGTATRTTFVTSTVTLPQLAERVKALLDDNLTSGVIK